MKSIRSQTELIAEGLEFMSKYIRDEAAFAGFNAVRFVVPFKAAFQQSIDSCMNFNDDETMVDIQTEKTADVELVMEKARKNYGFIKYFVEEAFPENERRRNLLGADTYGDARKSVASMIVFLSNLHRQCTLYKATLIAAGATQTLIDEVLTLRNNLIAANTEQSSFIGERSISTQERNIRFDKLEDYIRSISRAGKLIFAENPAFLKQYLRFAGRNSTVITTTDTQTERTMISANGDAILLNKKLKITDFVEVENTGNTEIEVYVADAIQTPIPENAITIFAAQKIVITVSEYTDLGIKNMIVHNKMQQEGAVRVTILALLEEIM